MEDVFIRLFNVSVSAVWIVLAVVSARLVLRRAPKWTRLLMWALVALRLLLPFSIESGVSLVPSTETVPENIVTAAEPRIYTGFSTINSVVNPIITENLAPAPEASVSPMQIAVSVAAVVWLCGIAAMAVYGLVSWLRLRHRVREAVAEGGRVWSCDRVASPFILGVFRPRIIMPSALGGEEREMVLAHERAHLRRLDHVWKPLGFAILSVNWYNPAIWLAYVLLCRDIELACDERVIRELGEDAKATYSNALISASVSRRAISACPLAFGETSVKERVKNVLNYKKPAFWIIIAALIIAAALAVFFLTDPKKDDAGDVDSDTAAQTESGGGESGAVYDDGEWHNMYEVWYCNFTDHKSDVQEDRAMVVLSTRTGEYRFRENAASAEITGKYAEDDASLTLKDADNGDMLVFRKEDGTLVFDSGASGYDAHAFSDGMAFIKDLYRVSDRFSSFDKTEFDVDNDGEAELLMIGSETTDFLFNAFTLTATDKWGEKKYYAGYGYRTQEYRDMFFGYYLADPSRESGPFGIFGVTLDGEYRFYSLTVRGGALELESEEVYSPENAETAQRVVWVNTAFFTMDSPTYLNSFLELYPGEKRFSLWEQRLPNMDFTSFLIASGGYTETETNIVAKADNGRTYVFRKIGDTLVYDADASNAPIMHELGDGYILRCDDFDAYSVFTFCFDSASSDTDGNGAIERWEIGPGAGWEGSFAVSAWERSGTLKYSGAFETRGYSSMKFTEVDKKLAIAAVGEDGVTHTLFISVDGSRVVLTDENGKTID